VHGTQTTHHSLQSTQCVTQVISTPPPLPHSLVRHSVWCSPAAAWTTGSGSVTSMGTATDLSLALCPSCPQSFRPNVKSEPSSAAGREGGPQQVWDGALLGKELGRWSKASCVLVWCEMRPQPMDSHRCNASQGSGAPVTTAVWAPPQDTWSMLKPT